MQKLTKTQLETFLAKGLNGGYRDHLAAVPDV